MASETSKGISLKSQMPGTIIIHKVTSYKLRVDPILIFKRQEKRQKTLKMILSLMRKKWDIWKTKGLK